MKKTWEKWRHERIVPLILSMIILQGGLILGGCTTSPPTIARLPIQSSSVDVVSTTLDAPQDFPMQKYRELAARGRPVWQILTEASLVQLEVRRGGALAALGHDHIVASRSLKGLVAPADGQADFYLRVDELVLDDPDLRVAAGLPSPLALEAITATRVNMLTKVLSADAFPFIQARLERRATGEYLLRLRVRDGAHEYILPMQLEQDDRQLHARGVLALRQSDFGIVPFSVLGGALQVQDQMLLRFSIRAGHP